MHRLDQLVGPPFRIGKTSKALVCLVKSNRAISRSRQTVNASPSESSRSIQRKRLLLPVLSRRPDATFLHADQYTPEFVDEPIARRPQFTLQGILVFTTLACVLLAGYQRMPLIRRMLVFLIVVMLILLAALYSYSIAYSLLCRRLKPTEDESSK